MNKEQKRENINYNHQLYAILSLLSVNNAYQFIGTDYDIPYIIWIVISIIFAGVSLFSIKKS